EVGVVALGGIGVGVALGAAVPALVRWGFGAALPLPPAGGVYPAPLAEAALMGLLTAAVFALWPLGRAARTPGAALFRGAALADTGGGRPGAAVIAAILVLAAALAALVLGGAGDVRLAAGFGLGVPAALAVFGLAGWGVRAGLAVLPTPRGAAWRIGLGNLHRPGARVGPMLSAIGLGLATLVAVGQVQGALRRLVLDALPAHGPSFFFVDLEPAQLARFRAMIRAVPGARDLRLVPTLRARIVAVNGVPAARVKAAPGTGWALRGDRGLTYAATPPPGTRLVAGRWWPANYSGPPLVSLDARLARGWGVGIGGVIQVDVLGRDIALRVASLREIRWQRLGINFVMVASPGLLSAAPQTELGTVRVPPAAEAPLLNAVARAFPNVTPIAVRSVLRQVAGLLRQIAAALAAVGAVTLLAGGLVLGAAVAAGQARRRRQAVLLRVLGASAGQIRAAFLIEFATLGLVAGVLAAGVGTMAAWAILHWLMAVPFTPAPAWAAAAVAAACLLVTALGWVGTRRVLRTPPAALLREG
ncbi:MAG: ABC transporter permease, partial [Acetobacteraceae bacterium]